MCRPLDSRGHLVPKIVQIVQIVQIMASCLTAAATPAGLCTPQCPPDLSARRDQPSQGTTTGAIRLPRAYIAREDTVAIGRPRRIIQCFRGDASAQDSWLSALVLRRLA